MESWGREGSERTYIFALSSLISSLFVSRLAAFTLCKENLETLEAISYMAAALGVLPSDFTYAGIKDKRAITYQSMVVKKVSPQR